VEGFIVPEGYTAGFSTSRDEELSLEAVKIYQSSCANSTEICEKVDFKTQESVQIYRELGSN
jgi:hypothetical protein